MSSILLKAPDSLPEKYRRNLIGSKPRPTWHLKRKPSGKDAFVRHALKQFPKVSFISRQQLFGNREIETYRLTEISDFASIKIVFVKNHCEVNI